MTEQDASAPIQKGLEDVVVDESRISLVDGERGDLWYRGYHVDDLAASASFEEVLFLLLHDRLPDESELAALRADLAANRSLPESVLETVVAMAPRAAPMDVLRTAVSMLAVEGAVDPTDDESTRAALLRVVGAMPTVVAATHRVRSGLDPVPPTDDPSHAANFLAMLEGESPSADRARALDVALVLYAEHGMNASTFAAVVTASTLSNPYAAMSAAVGALQGPLHGGATETVLETLAEVGRPADAAAWVTAALEAGERIPGFGHRVYRVADPRCAHFAAQIEALGRDGEVRRLFETAEALRDAVEGRLGEKGVYPNTDLYSGILYRALDVPSALSTAVFAMGRSAGWGAHVLEQRADNRIIRPRVHYVGETGREYVPLGER
jgi:citrate synthase